MRAPQRRVARLIAVLLTLTVLAAACGSSGSGSTTDTSKSDGSTATTAAGGVDLTKLSGTLNGSGSSFADGLYQQIITAMADKAPDLTVNYNPVGSGQGKKDFAAKLNDFAGTDSLVKPEESPAGTYVYVPTAAAPITVSYNLDGVDTLHLGAETLAKIFQGEIKSWDDPAIKSDNSGVTLPSKPIVIVHRADGSGTTSAFTKYLTKAAGAAWKLGAGDTVAWPGDSQAGQKNTGVAQIVHSTKGAIGYVDFADAKASKLSFAAIKNKDGNFVSPSLQGASAALASAAPTPELTVDVLDAPGATTYPITAVTYLLLRPSYDAKKGALVKGFVTYVLTDGQSQAAGVDYAKLPDALAKQGLAQLAKVTVG